MAVESKYYFYKVIEKCKCSDIMHVASNNCFESTLWNLTQTLSGCCKFVFPIAIVINI